MLTSKLISKDVERMRMYTHKCLVQPAPGHGQLLTGNYALQFVKKYHTNYVFFTIFIIHTFLKQIIILNYKSL